MSPPLPVDKRRSQSHQESRQGNLGLHTHSRRHTGDDVPHLFSCRPVPAIREHLPHRVQNRRPEVLPDGPEVVLHQHVGGTVPFSTAALAIAGLPWQPMVIRRTPPAKMTELTGDWLRGYCIGVTNPELRSMTPEDRVAWLGSRSITGGWTVGEDVFCLHCDGVWKAEDVSCDLQGDPTCPVCRSSTPLDFHGLPWWREDLVREDDDTQYVWGVTPIRGEVGKPMTLPPRPEA